MSDLEAPDSSDDRSAAPRLFEHFPAVSTRQWEARIEADLGERSYDDVLTWNIEDGVPVRPYYRAEDLERLAHMNATNRQSVSSRWSIRQDIHLGPNESMRRQLRHALDGGVDVVGLRLVPFSTSMQHTAPGIHAASSRTGLDITDVESMLEGVDLENTRIHVEAGLESLAIVEALERDGRKDRSVSAAFDPLSHAIRTGRYAAGWMNDAAAAVRRLSGRLVCIAADPYHDAGADLIDETALLLAATSEYLMQMGLRDVDVGDALAGVYFSVPVGASYFPAIARLRALRILLPQVFGAYDADPASASVVIHASTSRRNMTLYDPHMNLLRASTEAAAAVIGGCDVLLVHPYDALSDVPSDRAYRLSRNVQHVLRHEAHLDKVDDPSGGSYYVEALTDLISRRAWSRFQSIEARGGFLKATKDGYVGEIVGKGARYRRQAVSTGRRLLVGTNHFPNPDEERLADVENDTLASGRGDRAYEQTDLPEQPGTSREIDDEAETLGLPLPPRRDAEPFERIRLRTEAFANRSGGRPTAAVLPVGTPAESRRHADYASNVLAAAGFAVEQHPRLDPDAGGDSAPANLDTDVLVIAVSTDVSTSNVLRDIIISNKHIIIGLAREIRNDYKSGEPP
ncbi:MAG: methylmalonyl-CoA mutase family protein, partial [Rhodothermales bacterium]